LTERLYDFVLQNTKRAQYLYVIMMQKNGDGAPPVVVAYT